MTVETLRHLVAEAQTIAGAHPCTTFGHAWESKGGRACDYCANGSQPVFQCARCGDWDYGEPGGPGFEDCRRWCMHFEDPTQ